MAERNLKKSLEVLFHPGSIAILGASNSFAKWGFIIPSCIVNGGYKGRLYPVNPNADRVLGRKAYPSVTAIPDEVDLAIIVTPPPKIPELIEDCGRKGVKALVVITSSFSETGEEGKAAEERIAALARKNGIPMVGPNSMGIVSTRASLYATMAPFTFSPGPLSIASQSGNLGTRIMLQSAEQGIGVNKLVSSGNEADITITDYLEYFGQDPDTKIIALYIEGIDDGPCFMEVAKSITSRKPVIVLKGGRNRAGATAAASHTGALAGTSAVYEAMFRQCGIVQAYSTAELVDLAYGFTVCPPPRGRRVCLVTRGGGWGVLAADYCEDLGLEVAPLPRHLVNRFDEFLPPYWSRGNPIDMVASLNLSDFGTILKLVLEDDSYDAVVGLAVTVQSPTAAFAGAAEGTSPGIDAEQIKALERLVSDAGVNLLSEVMTEMRRRQKPVLFVGTPTDIRTLEDGTPIHIFPDPERAIHALAALVRHAEYRRARTGQCGRGPG